MHVCIQSFLTSGMFSTQCLGKLMVTHAQHLTKRTSKWLKPALKKYQPAVCAPFQQFIQQQKYFLGIFLLSFPYIVQKYTPKRNLYIAFSIMKLFRHITDRQSALVLQIIVSITVQVSQRNLLMNRIVSFTASRYQKYLCITAVILYQHFFEALISIASSREAFSD